ncbi:DUF5405 family protein [Yersinia kristensenii]|uniref:DUF5405 family protein n=1 Tax=Yersinia kristensenii TaxID=28152 RepID=UPI0005E9DB8C|nr:DUF5405 family protein [Yersinia kristensenii]CNH37411.1 putative relication initiation protein [Yersinia kristensenii]
MNIKIGEQHLITSDSQQFILNEIKISKEGKNKGQERLEPIGYYPTIEMLVAGLIRRHIGTVEINSLSSLANEIERIGKLCQAAFSSMNKG